VRHSLPTDLRGVRRRLGEADLFNGSAAAALPDMRRCEPGRLLGMPMLRARAGALHALRRPLAGARARGRTSKPTNGVQNLRPTSLKAAVCPLPLSLTHNPSTAAAERSRETSSPPRWAATAPTPWDLGQPGTPKRSRKKALPGRRAAPRRAAPHSCQKRQKPRGLWPAQAQPQAPSSYLTVRTLGARATMAERPELPAAAPKRQATYALRSRGTGEPSSGPLPSLNTLGGGGQASPGASAGQLAAHMVRALAAASDARAPPPRALPEHARADGVAGCTHVSSLYAAHTAPPCPAPQASQLPTSKHRGGR
jgi:hypothetical protein